MANQRYHINPKTGNPGQCRAAVGNCPFGEDTEHYGSKEEAYAAYEKIMKDKDNQSTQLVSTVLEEAAQGKYGRPFMTVLNIRNVLENTGRATPEMKKSLNPIAKALDKLSVHQIGVSNGYGIYCLVKSDHVAKINKSGVNYRQAQEVYKDTQTELLKTIAEYERGAISQGDLRKRFSALENANTNLKRARTNYAYAYLRAVPQDLDGDVPAQNIAQFQFAQQMRAVESTDFKDTRW